MFSSEARCVGHERAVGGSIRPLQGGHSDSEQEDKAHYVHDVSLKMAASLWLTVIER
jgi:hypothetical protein